MSVISVGPHVTPWTASQAHTLAFTALAVAVGLGGLAVPPVPVVLTALGLAVAVVVVGLPHGGLDHRVGRALLQPRFGPWWPLPFLTGYLLVGACVLAGWCVAPFCTIASFLMLSAVHFGDTESGPRWRATLFGGLPIWVPLLAKPGETATLLGWVTPGGVDVAEPLAALRPALFAVAGFAAVVWLVGVVASIRDGDRDGQLDALRLAVTAGMLAVAPVLVGFAVAFCGWHSLRELGRLAVRAEPLDPALGFRRVVVAAAPLALVAAGLAVAGAWYSGGGREVGPVVVQAVFLGLSAVAVPHILLHAVAARSGADPFSAEDREVTGAL
jgi:Brp/Blh family beta-carotene 15,15'-monooxygenase